MYLWLDLETTGLDEDNDFILEIGAVLTDRSLNTIDIYHEVRVLALWRFDHRMNDTVRAMHTKSGLLQEIDAAYKKTPHLDESLAPFEAWLGKHANKTTHLAGSSVHFDARFIRYELPTVLDGYHHRMLDVSAIKLFYYDVTGRALLKEESKHRSLPDIAASIAEYRAYLAWARLQAPQS